MWDIIFELLGINDDLLNRGRILYWRVIARSIIALLLLLLIGSLANYCGWKGLDLLIAFALGVAGVTLALYPDALLYTAELGILSGLINTPPTVEQEVRRFLSGYFQAAAKLLFWISGIFFILGTISIEENPWVVLGILAAATVIFSYVVGYNPKMVIARRVVYAYACFMLVMLIFSLVPRHSWIRTTGIDVKGFFASTPTEVGVSDVRKEEELGRQSKNAKILKVLQRKVAQGGGKPLNEILSPEELAKFKELEKEVTDRSLGKGLSTLFERREAQAATKKEEPPTPPPPAQQQLAAMPAPPPPAPLPPTIVAPKPLPPEHKVPDWKLTEEDMDGGVYHIRNLRCTVKFSADRETVTIRMQHGNWYLFKGKRVGERKYEGTWRDEFPRDQYYYWGHFGIEFAEDTQSAYGWKTIRDDSYNRIKTTFQYDPMP